MKSDKLDKSNKKRRVSQISGSSAPKKSKGITIIDSEKKKFNEITTRRSQIVNNKSYAEENFMKIE